MKSGLAGMMGLAIQYLLQMLLGFREKSDDLGAIFNILIYTPCIIAIAMGIYNIEATDAIAGSAAALNFEFYCYFIIGAFNGAAISFYWTKLWCGTQSSCAPHLPDLFGDGIGGMCRAQLDVHLARGILPQSLHG